MGVIKDRETVRYFDEHVPEYNLERLEHVVEAIERVGGQQPSLVDIGCGAGNTLAFLKEQARLGEVCGIDVSEQCLRKTRERVEGRTHCGSILDNAFLREIDAHFDFALLSAVLHHLIGRTRRESRRYAELAIANAAELLKPGGYLIVQEPVYYPIVAMDSLFYVKKLLTKVTAERVTIFNEWNNIGPPVVSYYTNEQLIEMVEAGGRNEIVAKWIEPERLAPALRPILNKTNTTLVVRARGA
jgi:SAM-dependent methyltransferase